MFDGPTLMLADYYIPWILEKRYTIQRQDSTIVVRNKYAFPTSQTDKDAIACIEDSWKKTSSDIIAAEYRVFTRLNNDSGFVLTDVICKEKEGKVG